MTNTTKRLRQAGGCATAAAALLTAAPAGAADWQLVPLPPPPGGTVSAPAGRPGDLSFIAPNRGLMPVDGNNSVPRGIYSWDGHAWHQLSTVCGPADLSGNYRPSPVIWAGPREFWTITHPSPGLNSPSGALCHFKDGAVVGSFGRANVAGYEYVLSAGACRAADDCWFGGAPGVSLDGAQAGGFRIRWDGARLLPSYAPQGREVTDMEPLGGQIVETVRVRPSISGGGAPVLRDPEPVPALLHWNDGGAFRNDPWTPAPADGVPIDGTDLLALDSDGATTWAVGGGGDSTQRLPVVARTVGGEWREIALSGADLQPGDTFTDVAVVPGTDTAWATVNGSPPGMSGPPRVAFVAADGEVTVQRLGGAGDRPRGAALRVACSAPDDCWMASALGYVYRWGGSALPRDDDPAFQGTITERPNEGAAQFVPDTPPADDSRLHAPPVEVPVEEEQQQEEQCRRPPALMSGVRADRPKRLPGQPKRARNPRFELTVRFRLARSARVSLVAEHRAPATGGASGRTRPRRAGERVGKRTRIVARTRLRTLRAGRRRLTITVRQATWPTRLRFVLRETRRPRCR